MSVLYFQGFDMMRWVTGTGGGLVVLDGDEALQWGYNTFSRMEFVEGYESEHAGAVVPSWRPMTLKHTAMAGQATNEFRFGMWAKGKLMSPGAPGRYFLYVYNGTNGFAIRAYADGHLGLYQLKTGTGAYDFEIDNNDELDLFEAADWHHYEFYGNISTGEATLLRDGFPILSGTGDPGVTGTLTFRVGSPEIASSIAPSTWDYYFDHVYVTDGPAVPNLNVAGVSIEAAVDMFEGGPGFRSTMMFGETRYLSDVQKGWITSETGSGTEGVNNTNVLTYFWMNDPRTGEEWNSLSDIDAFGLCYGSDIAQGSQRVAALTLNWLTYNDGKPLVRYQVPGSIGSYSGPWTKSDTGKTFSGLVSTIPRPDVVDAEEVDSIFCSGPGCILFYPTPEDDDDRPVVSTGLTFAEEFREDYRDWVRIDSIGTSYDSFFTSGFGVFGEGNKKFQDNYITVNYKNVQNGAAYIQGLWDYAFDQDTGRWSMRQSVYTNDEGYTHRSRRLKIRGHGKALQIKVSNKGDKPFTINGWSMFVTSNGSV